MKNTRPLISKPYDLKEIYPEFETYKLYLAYIHQLDKYLLIQNKNNEVFFKPLEIKCNPTKFYTDYDKQENYENLEKEIKKILKPHERELKDGGAYPHEIKENIEYTLLEIIDFLAEEVSNIYGIGHYTKVGSYPQSFKQFILNPVGTYNQFLNIDTKDINEKLDDITDEITETLQKLSRLYNENKTFMKPKHKNHINNTVKWFIDSTTADPFLCLHLGYKPVKYYQARAGQDIVNEFGLKRHLINNETSKLYFYDKDLKYFDEITTQQLKKKLYNNFGFNLTETDINTITKAVPTEDILYKNLLVFNNLYYDTNTLDEFKPFPENNKYNRKNYLTVYNIGTLNEQTDTINLLDYNKELKLSDVITIKELPEINPNIPVNTYYKKYGMTLTEIVLRQILIPKDNPNDIRLFRDYLERLGSNIYGRNLYKALTFYYGDGDNAKSILNLFNNLIFNKLNYEIKPDAFTEQFSLESFNNRLLISIDEVTRDSFKDLKDYLKQITSKYSKMEKRQMYTNKTFTIYGFPNINIYSNELLTLNTETDGALFSRIDYLKLPNKFLTNKEVPKYNNCYPVVDGLEDLLQQDKDGLSWLITAGILCFKDMKEKNKRYTLKQTREETIDIFLSIDYLTKFLMMYTEFVEDLPRELYTSNEEITNGYLQYMERLNKNVDFDGISKEIGIKLRQTYPELKLKENKYKQTGTGKTMYKLKLKGQEDIIREFNQAYNINEHATDKQLNILSTNSKLQTVYKHIQKGHCTIAILNNKLPKGKYNCLEIVQQLESLNLIYNTGTSILTPPEEVI